MDISRALLDNLMGRDRNKPIDLITTRDHYSNPDVCKPFLVCFCFNSLFPNTTYDQGPCEKRHDTYLKNMFDNDLQRADYQKQYIKECIKWIQRRLVDVEQKTKKNWAVIENKSAFPMERSKETIDRLIAIDQDIEKLMIDAQKFGQSGDIDGSARCIEDAERLRERRREIELMGDSLTAAQKQQTVCGAIQTVNDTDKRIMTHLEGKIHQGFLKLRHEVQTLRIRLEMLNKIDGSKKDQGRSHVEKETRYDKNNQNQKERHEHYDKENNHQERKKKKDKQRDRQRDREMDMQRSRYREKRQHQSKKEKKNKHHYSRDRSPYREGKKSKDRSREHKKKNRYRSRSGDRYQERY